MPDPTGPVTLGDLIREEKLLRIYCRGYGHERDSSAPLDGIDGCNGETDRVCLLSGRSLLRRKL